MFPVYRAKFLRTAFFRTPPAMAASVGMTMKIVKNRTIKLLKGEWFSGRTFSVTVVTVQNINEIEWSFPNPPFSSYLLAFIQRKGKYLCKSGKHTHKLAVTITIRIIIFKICFMGYSETMRSLQTRFSSFSIRVIFVTLLSRKKI